MDMKKLLNIVDSNVEKKQINESMEECGMPMSSSSPSSGNVSMNLSMNAQGVDNIKQLLDLMKAASAPTRMSEPMAMPSPGMDMPISITKIKPAGSDGPSGMAQIRDLISKADSPKPFENSPEEAYSDVDSVTTDAGGGVNGPKNPADIRIKDPSPYNATSEEFANEPDEEVSDHHTMIKDLSGGLNKEKQQYKKEYPGDNPMAVAEAKEQQLWKVILVSWLIAFFEYCLQVPANRIGSSYFSLFQLKTIQEVISLSVFSLFAVLVMNETMKWNHLLAFLFLIMSVVLIFKEQ
jgi:uncharacterized protein (DUF486 family)